jgi:hypothetical protein
MTTHVTIYDIFFKPQYQKSLIIPHLLIGNQIAKRWMKRKKMKYLEIIELRTSDMDSKNLGKILIRFMDDLNKEYENYKVQLYRHLTVKTDWSFYVRIQSGIKTTLPSQLGLRIASALKEFGLVHHSVWSEEKRRI